MRIEKIKEDFPFITDDRFPSCHASTLVEMPNHNLLCAFYAGAYEGSPDSAILASEYQAENATWLPPKIIADTPNLPEGNPVLFLDEQGVLWLFFVTMLGKGWDTCKVKFQQSFDLGKSWGQPKILHDELGWMTRNKPLTLANGDVILPMYDERDWTSFFLISEDKGKSWFPTHKLIAPVGIIQPAVVEREAGELFAFMRCGSEGKNIWFSRSRDWGRNWTNPQPISLPNPNSGIDAISLQEGGMILAFNNSSSKRTPLTLAYSEDGYNWEIIGDVENEDGEFSYPCLLQTRDGLLHLTYTYKRVGIKHCIFKILRH
ncbi:MAG: sialidase family protein [bacterium]